MQLLSLFRFQAEDVEKLKSKRSRLIGNDPGTGKTYEGIALDVANRKGDGHPKVEVPKVCKTLVICPKSVLGVWDQHLMDLTDDDIYLYDLKTRDKFIKDFLNPWKAGYFIVNWDSLRLMPELNKVKWFHIIADEVHRAKNRKAQVNRALKNLRTVYKTGMSGTPADDKPQDLWAILNWLWPNYYTAFNKFVNAYCIFETDPESGYKKFYGLNEERIPELWKEMAPWFTRRLKEDVLPDLPNKYYSRIWVELGPKQRKAYNEMKRTMTAWVDQNQDALDRNDPVIAQAAVVQLIRLQQYADGYVVPKLDKDGNYVYKNVKKAVKDSNGKIVDHEIVERQVFLVTDPSAKLDAIEELLKDRANDQIIIFSQFKSVVALLQARLEKSGIAHGVLTGDVKAQDRTASIAAFQRGETRVFVGTIGAAREGITLTASSTIIFIDRAWSPSRNKQAEDRAHRIGQEEAVEIIDVMARNTVDLGKIAKIELKAKFLRMILGDEVQLKKVYKELNYGSPTLEITIEGEED